MARLHALLALCVVALAASLAPARSTAQTAPEPKAANSTAVTNFSIDGSNVVKYPDAAGVSDQIFVAGNPGSDNDTREAKAWNKQDKSTSNFGTRFTLGDARGQTDYSSAAIATNRLNNSIHAVWIDRQTRTIYYRTRGLSSGWGETRFVHRAPERGPYYVKIGVSTGGRIFVVWSEADRIRYRTSTDNGVSWSDARIALNSAPFGRPSVAGGPGDLGSLVFSAGGNIRVGVWDGSEFVMQTITDGAQWFDPTTTIAPDGKIYVAYRNVGDGVYYNERQSNGTWPNATKIQSGEMAGTTPIVSDSQGNIHLFWVRKASRDMNYAFKPANGAFETPVRVGNPGGSLDNPSAGATLSDYGYGHGVTEFFGGRGLETRYFLFRSDASTCPVGDIVFDDTDGATNLSQITGTIVPSNCSPTLRKVQLNTQDDSIPGEPWTTNRFTLPVPANQLGLCTQTVNVRLFKDSSSGGWFKKTIKVDPATDPTPVDAAVSLENFYYDGKDIAANGPSDGDPRFTRKPMVNLRINDAGDCSGLTAWASYNASSNIPLDQGGFTSGQVFKTVALPDLNKLGLQSLRVDVADAAGNVKSFLPPIYYDPSDTTPVTPNDDDGLGRPVVTSAFASADNDAAGRLTILRTLSFTDTVVNDNYYTPANVPGLPEGGEFWGVWVAVEYLTPGSPPADDPTKTTLVWTPVEVESRTCGQTGCSFSVPVNLFTGQSFGPDLTKSGQYRVYTRFLDGAGNPSAVVKTAIFQLDAGYRLPGSMLSIITK